MGNFANDTFIFVIITRLPDVTFPFRSCLAHRLVKRGLLKVTYVMSNLDVKRQRPKIAAFSTKEFAKVM